MPALEESVVVQPPPPTEPEDLNSTAPSSQPIVGIIYPPPEPFKSLKTPKMNLPKPITDSTEKKKKRPPSYQRPSISKKLEIIQRLNDGQDPKKVALELGVSYWVVNRVKQNKQNLLKMEKTLKEQHGSTTIKRYSAILDSGFEKALFTWFAQQRDCGEAVSGVKLRNEALRLHALVNGPSNFKASNGWLCSFKQRHGIREVPVQEEKLSSDVKANEELVSLFRRYFAMDGYSLENLYNADETGLFWKCQPRRTLISRNEISAPGFTAKKDRITVMVSANALGSHQVPLMVIGKAKKPRCFKNIETLPIAYTSQANAWMDKTVFLHWFQNVFVPAIQEKQEKSGKVEKVLLVLDNAPSHPVAEELNAIDPNIQVFYLPPNVTALIQPMDQGVIEVLKMLYRNKFCAELILDAKGMPPNVEQFVKKWDLLSCISALSSAWNSMGPDTLRNAWNNILNGQPLQHEINMDDCSRVIQKAFVPNLTSEELHEWLAVDRFECGWEVQSSEALFNSLNSNTACDVNNDSQSDSEDLNEEDNNEQIACETVPMTAAEACDSFKKCYHWFSTRWESQPEDLIHLDKMRSVAISAFFDERNSK